jgi:hypothetical protein
MSDIHTSSIENLVREGQGSLMVLESNDALDFGNNQAATSRQVITLSAQHQTQIEDIAADCSRQFTPKEPTLAQTRFGLASLFARVDCTITKDGIEVYESEERPAGLGLAHCLIRTATGKGVGGLVLDHCEDYAGETPLVMRHKDAKPNDDDHIFQVVNLDDSSHGRPVIVRAEPHQITGHPELDNLVSSSISTVMSKGNKGYATLIPSLKSKIAEAGFLPDKTTSFVLKPVCGSKSHGVNIYVAPDDRALNGNHGTVTHSRALRVIDEAERNSYIIEAFKPPMSVLMPDGKIGNMILRVFVLLHPNRRAEAIGGTYVARKEILVHGASNSINGAVVLE